MLEHIGGKGVAPVETTTVIHGYTDDRKQNNWQEKRVVIMDSFLVAWFLNDEGVHLRWRSGAQQHPYQKGKVEKKRMKHCFLIFLVLLL